MNISEEHFIGEGLHRKVFVHPKEPSLCIKIPKASLGERNIKREIHYLLHYSKKCHHFTSLFHDTVLTDKGIGYVFDLIRNEDGSISNPLKRAHARKLHQLEDKLTQLYQVCLTNRIIVSDLHPGNIVIRRTVDNDYNLWIIDGVGNSDYFKICDYSQYFLKKKLIRKFTFLSQCLNLPMTFS